MIASQVATAAKIPKRRRNLTTGQIADMCDVAPRTVVKWIDKGDLVGYHIAGSLDRRVQTQELLRFLKLHNMPMGKALARLALNVLIIDGTDLAVDIIFPAIEELGNCALRHALNDVQAGYLLNQLHPRVIIVETDSSAHNVRDILTLISTEAEMVCPDLYALTAAASADVLNDTYGDVFTGILPKPLGSLAIVSVVRNILEN